MIPKEGDLIVSIGALPFESGLRKVLMVPGGARKTIADILGPVPECDRHSITVQFKGEVIPEDQWDTFMTGEERYALYINVVPHNRNVLAIVAAVALYIFAPYAAAYIAGASSGFAYTAALAGVTVVGSYAIGQMLGPEVGGQNDITRDPQRFGIQSTQNSVPSRRNSVLCVMGTHRVAPYFACRPYVFVDGPDTLVFRGLYDFGYGPIDFDVDSFRFGDSAISGFQNATVVTHEGLPNTLSELSDFSETHDQRQVNKQLEGTSEGAGEWSEFSYKPGVNRAVLIVSFNSLLRLSKKGDKENRTVTFEIQKKEGTGVWSNSNEVSATAATTSQHFLEMNISLTTNVGGSIRIRRSTSNEDDVRVQDVSILTHVDFITPETPVKALGRALAFVQITADRNLNNIVQTFTAICTRKIPFYQGGAWTAPRGGAGASSPAWQFASILRGPGIVAPIPDENIDAEALAEWASRCATRGYRYDGVWNNAEGIWDRLNTVAACGRASATLVDGKVYSVVVDQEKTVPVDLITPKDTLQFTGTKAFKDPPHGFRGFYNDRDNEYQESEITVYGPGRNETNSTNIVAVQLAPLGITTAAEVHKFLRYLLANELLRPESFRVIQDIKHLRLQRGDYVDLLYDAPLIGLGAARLIETDASRRGDGRWGAFSLEEDIELSTGQNHTVRFQTLSGEAVILPIVKSRNVSIPTQSVRVQATGVRD